MDQPLERLPVLTKSILMEHFDEIVTDGQIRLSEVENFLSRNPGPMLFRNRYVVLATSGSTGVRGLFIFSLREWIEALAFITRPLVWSGHRPKLFRSRRAAFIASTTPWHYSARVSQSLSNRLLPALRLDAGEPIENIVQKLNEWQPETMAVYPSVLRQLADEQIAGRLHIPLVQVATSAEVLTAETRRRAQEAWNVHVYETYGATEYAPIAAECSSGRMHLVEDGAVVEIVDETGKATPPGVRGERVLLTVFNRTTQPLIRYEISDMVLPLEGSCECGRPFRLVKDIEGRKEDILCFPSVDGSEIPVHPNVFHELLETCPFRAGR